MHLPMEMPRHSNSPFKDNKVNPHSMMTSNIRDLLRIMSKAVVSGATRTLQITNGDPRRGLGVPRVGSTMITGVTMMDDGAPKATNGDTEMNIGNTKMSIGNTRTGGGAAGMIAEGDVIGVAKTTGAMTSRTTVANVGVMRTIGGHPMIGTKGHPTTDTRDHPMTGTTDTIDIEMHRTIIVDHLSVAITHRDLDPMGAAHLIWTNSHPMAMGSPGCVRSQEGGGVKMRQGTEATPWTNGMGLSRNSKLVGMIQMLQGTVVMVTMMVVRARFPRLWQTG